MRTLYIIGGQQKDRIADEWHQYQKGVIVKLDLDNKRFIKSLEYISPQEVCPNHDPSIVFKAGTVKNKQLYVCTQTEILIYSLPQLNLIGYLSLPCFNDVHHIRPNHNGNYLIANTGLDMVLELNPNGTISNEWNVLGQNPWERFSRTIDYRKILTTKPHQSHPNYVFLLGNDIWVTRCLQKDAICLTKSNHQINIGGSLVHDGILVGNTIYFTKVDGHIVTVDANTLKVKNEYNLNDFSNAKNRLGWCRGIKVLNNDTVIVGFTRVRPSKNGLQGAPLFEQENDILPTRIACYHLSQRKLLWEFDLEPFGLNAVFSIHSEDE
ncbi:hypothetical protein P5G62_011745 [Neobacillus sp. 179-C4.2 HS]|uniref:Uncharacterized protein n=1 Tax=Neobacillus driksii TaxID=3035913 RepID=A0ABV4YT76_9BACI|nr:hypothetical protein [Neobacillus sp. 179.-C4.2 HS]MDP5194100.1 hypothetical protein [Neobacillus sp. 179.-C4.2 HS]